MAAPVLSPKAPSVTTARAREPQRGRTAGRRRRDALTGWVLISPALIHFVVFMVLPAAMALYFSFTDWNLRETAEWTGLENYRALLSDELRFPHFWPSVKVTLYFTVVSVPVALAVALTQAMLINSVRRGSNLFRLLLFLPVVTAEAAVGVIWRWLYDPQYGLLNTFLGLFGVPAQNWLNEADLVIPALVVIAAWQSGTAMIIYLAGLKGIPHSLYEAATIDGAGFWQRFRHVTIPQLRPTTFYLLVTHMIAALQVFGLVFTIFSAREIGGPEQSGLSFVLYLYLNAFRYDAMGAACAMSFILFVLIMIVTALQFRFVRQGND
ncbi:carbohydrate ABC transporter permease [Streptomyces formicae]|uniref:Sugar ABC transporter permease n=1 Tax=Streptomyces formicae TaxID=1616117 RepID=A0ABY3WKD7_9ACTN|nr:sugar ABC transporter permease [Streptomyces formicae]UNM12150.1 sugar ABC transporter permease [Streptomyces formicae]